MSGVRAGVCLLLLLVSSCVPGLDDPIKIDSGLVGGTRSDVNSNTSLPQNGLWINVG